MAERPSRQGPGPRLAVIEGWAGRRSAIPFVLLVLGVLVAGLIGLLTLNTAMDENSVRMQKAEQRQAQLSDRAQQLSQRLSGLSGPGALASAAAAQGLVPNPQPAFLNPTTGAVLGSPSAAPSPSSSPKPSLKPSASGSATATATGTATASATASASMAARTTGSARRRATEHGAGGRVDEGRLRVGHQAERRGRGQRGRRGQPGQLLRQLLLTVRQRGLPLLGLLHPHRVLVHGGVQHQQRHQADPEHGEDQQREGDRGSATGESLDHGEPRARRRSCFAGRSAMAASIAHRAATVRQHRGSGVLRISGRSIE